MTWSELFTSHPELGRAAKDIDSILQQLDCADTPEYCYPDSPLCWLAFVALHCWSRLRELQGGVEATKEAATTWIDLGECLDASGEVVRAYLSCHGRVAHLPADFVRAFKKGLILDASMEQSADFPGCVVMNRPRKTGVLIPASILRQLSQERDPQSKDN